MWLKWGDKVDKGDLSRKYYDTILYDSFSVYF